MSIFLRLYEYSGHAGKYMFHLRAGENRFIGTGETHDFVVAREKGIKSVKLNSSNSRVLTVRVKEAFSSWRG